MTSFKLDSLSIFLILLFVIVFAMVFKNSWDSMLQTKEGFAGVTLAGYSGGHVEPLYDNLYFDTEDRKILEENDDGTTKTVNALIEYTENMTSGIETSTNGVLIVMIPYEERTFIHLMNLDSQSSLGSYFFEGSFKSEIYYPGEESKFIIESETLSTSWDKITYSSSNTESLQTKVINVDKTYLLGMKYLKYETLILFKKDDSTGLNVIEDSKTRTVQSDADSTDKTINVKFGDYEINLPQDTAESLASNLGKQLGGSFSTIFTKGGDYNNEYIHKTEVVPGFGYDYYDYGYYDRPRRGRRGRGYGGGYYDSELYDEEREGERDENGNLLRDFGEGSAALLRDGAKGTATLARDTARGASDLAKETASGTVGLAKETATGTVGLAKETVGGVKDLATDTASGTTNLARDAAGGTTNLARDAAGGATDAIGNTLSGTGDFIQSSASGIGNFAKDAASGTVGLAKDTVSGTVGLGREIVGGIGSGVGSLMQSNPTMVGGRGVTGGVTGGGYQMGGYNNAYGGPNMRQTHGMDPYSYYGAVPPRPSCNYIPRTADFSAFGR